MLTDEEIVAVIPEIVAFAMEQTAAKKGRPVMCGHAVMAMISCTHTGRMASMEEGTRAAVIGHAVDLFIDTVSL